MKLLNTFKKRFDTALFSFLDEKERSISQLDKRGGEVVQSIKIFLQYGGKRFRPALFYFAYKSFAEKKSFNHLKFSFIFELFHSFALIHDDIIDHSNLRRGNLTIHAKYGLAMGVLSGDFALTLVDEIYIHLISQPAFTTKEITEINKLFNTYKQELLVGQYLDCIHLDDREKIMKLKTADYSFVKPVLFALQLTGQNKLLKKKWQDFLTRLGIVFQLKDDYEGVFSDQKKTGKSSLSDSQEGKNTYIVELFKQRANAMEFSRFNTFFGKNTLSSTDFGWYIKLLIQKSIKDDVILKIQTECEELIGELEKNLGEHKPLHTLIQELIIYINTF